MRLAMKMFLVLAMTIAIMIPLMMIRGTIQERQAYRMQAVADIARSYAGAQAFAGPVLVVPYVETVEVEEKDAQGLIHKVLREESRRWTFFPAMLDVFGHLQPDIRQRGLHKVRIYEFRGVADATFDVTVPADLEPSRPRRIGDVERAG